MFILYRCYSFPFQTRLSINAGWKYITQLEEKCKRLEEGKLVHADVERLTSERDEARIEAHQALKSRAAIEAKFVMAENKVKAMEQEKADAMAYAQEMKAKSQGLRDELSAVKKALDLVKRDKDETEAKYKQTLQEKEDYLKSEDFKVRLGSEILPHWHQGMRIGVRQAVARFQGGDVPVEYFEPNYDDPCGEPDLADSDEDAGAGGP